MEKKTLTRSASENYVLSQSCLKHRVLCVCDIKVLFRGSKLRNK